MHGFETQSHREVGAGLPKEFVLVPPVHSTGKTRHRPHSRSVPIFLQHQTTNQTNTMANNQTTKSEGTALETEIWLPLKEASTKANRCDATIKRAIKNGKLVGRKVGAGHNASYEVSETSFTAWLETQAKPTGELLDQVDQEENAEAVTAPAETPTENQSGLSKAERRKLKAARKKEIPESARRLRRWKNYMRHADQQQAVAMIKWLSARLDPKKSLSKKIAKEAIRNDRKSQTPA